MTDDNSPFRLLSSTVVYDNGWIRVTEDKVVRPSGDDGIFGVVSMKEGSTVLPITDTGDVFLVREYKYGIGALSIEAMSGGLDTGEDPVDGAKRELAEELGLRAQRWSYLEYVDPFTTIVRSRNHMFLAEGLDKVDSQDDPDEVVEPLRMPLSEAVEMAMRGDLTHSASCVLLLKANRLLQMREAGK